MTIDNEHTSRAYRDVLLAAPAVEPRLALDDLNPMHLARWKELIMRLPLSIGTRRQKVAAMRSFVKWTYAMGWHELAWERAALVLKLPPKNVENPRSALTEDEAGRLLQAARHTGDEALIGSYWLRAYESPKRQTSMSVTSTRRSNRFCGFASQRVAGLGPSRLDPTSPPCSRSTPWDGDRICPFS